MTARPIWRRRGPPARRANIGRPALTFRLPTTVRCSRLSFAQGTPQAPPPRARHVGRSCGDRARRQQHDAASLRDVVERGFEGFAPARTSSLVPPSAAARVVYAAVISPSRTLATGADSGAPRRSTAAATAAATPPRAARRRRPREARSRPVSRRAPGARSSRHRRGVAVLEPRRAVLVMEHVEVVPASAGRSAPRTAPGPGSRPGTPPRRPAPPGSPARGPPWPRRRVRAAFRPRSRSLPSRPRFGLRFSVRAISGLPVTVRSPPSRPHPRPAPRRAPRSGRARPAPPCPAGSGGCAAERREGDARTRRRVSVEQVAAFGRRRHPGHEAQQFGQFLLQHGIEPRRLAHRALDAAGELSDAFRRALRVRQASLSQADGASAISAWSASFRRCASSSPSSASISSLTTTAWAATEW